MGIIMRKTILLYFLFLLPFAGQAETPPWTTENAQGQTEVHLYLFWSLNCPHCLTARPQILELVSQQPWIRLHDHELSENSANVSRLVEMAKSLGQEAKAVPTLIYCGQMAVGWDDRPEAGKVLLSRLDNCRQNGIDGTSVPLSAPSLNIPLLGEIDAAQISLPLLTVLLASLDAFNPCAFFVLLFLLSLLVHQHDRRRMFLIGGVFVAISGLMYFAFMAAWLNLFLMIGSLPWVTTIAGGLALMIAAVNIKDFLIFKQGVSLSIPENRKADIFQRGRSILNAGSLPAMLAARARVLAQSSPDALRAWTQDERQAGAGRSEVQQIGALYAATLAYLQMRNMEGADRTLASLTERLAKVQADKGGQGLLQAAPEMAASRWLRLLRAEVAFKQNRFEAVLTTLVPNGLQANLPRPELIAVAQALQRLPQHPWLDGVTRQLRSTVQRSPNDAQAWQTLAGLLSLQGAALGALRAEGEAQIARLDWTGAVDRLRAAQDRARQGRLQPGDHIEASIVDARLRLAQDRLREMQVQR